MPFLGCEKSLLDRALFIFFLKRKEEDDAEKEPSGIAVTHVDDIYMQEMKGSMKK